MTSPPHICYDREETQTLAREIILCVLQRASIRILISSQLCRGSRNPGRIGCSQLSSRAQLLVPSKGRCAGAWPSDQGLGVAREGGRAFRRSAGLLCRAWADHVPPRPACPSASGPTAHMLTAVSPVPTGPQKPRAHDKGAGLVYDHGTFHSSPLHGGEFRSGSSLVRRSPAQEHLDPGFTRYSSGAHGDNKKGIRL